MSTLKQVKELARKLGAKVEDNKCGQTHECRVEAPKGKIWVCRDVHEMVDSSYRPWNPDYKDMLDNMKFGLDDCANPECEWCNPEE